MKKLNKLDGLRDYLTFAVNARGAGHLVHTLEASATDTTGGVDEAQAWSNALGAGFLRIDPIINEEVCRRDVASSSDSILTMIRSSAYGLICMSAGGPRHNRDAAASEAYARD